MTAARTSGKSVDAKSLSKKLYGIMHDMGTMRTKSSSMNDIQAMTVSNASGYEMYGNAHGNAFWI